MKIKKVITRAKVLLRHFKRKPSRLIIWTSIFAILIALIMTALDPNNIRVKAAPGITINGSDLTIIGDSAPNTYIDCIFVDFAGTVQTIAGHCDANQYMIDVDGYVLVRYIPDLQRRYGFEYVYYYDQNTKQRVQITPASNLIIDGNGTIVYMEGSKDNPLRMNRLEIKNGATLSQVPANKEGFNVPYSTGYYWGIQFMAYYYLGPDRSASFSMNTAGASNLSLRISENNFQRIDDLPYSSLGYRYKINDPNDNFCIAAQKNYWCGNPVETQEFDSRKIFSNDTGQGKYLAMEFTMTTDESSDFEGKVSHYEWQTSTGNPITDDQREPKPIPLEKFIGLAPDGAPAVADPGIDSNFAPAAGNAHTAFAYYFDQYGYATNPDHSTMNATLIYERHPRSFQTLNIPIASIQGYDTRQGNYQYNGSDYTGGQYTFWWNRSGQNAIAPNNPISRSVFAYGLDYLRAPIFEYVKKTLDGQEGSPKREARINIIADTINIGPASGIDVVGKGYPAGHAGWDAPNTHPVAGTYYYPIDYSLQLTGIPDSPHHGAGFGGGKGTSNDYALSACSGSYGGNGASLNFMGVNENYNKDITNFSCGHIYGNDQITSPQYLGSGGGAYNDGIGDGNEDRTSLGGAGGGSIHLKANSFENNGFVKANGGLGFVTPPSRRNGNENYNDPVPTSGQLGKPGYPALEMHEGFLRLQEDAFRWSVKHRGTAGSGGSIFVETDFYNNTGVIEARGVAGAVRFIKNNDIKENYKNYYNTDQYFICNPENDTSNCTNAPSGGGRISVIFNDDNGGAGKGTIRAWGGGQTADGEHKTVQLMMVYNNAYYVSSTAGDGSVYYSKSPLANVYNKIISIDKSVNLCNNGEDSCKAGATRDVDFGNATASSGAWMLVQIKLINNTGRDQNNITITDEKFSTLVDTATIKPVTDEPNWVNGATVGWNNISILGAAPNNEKTLEYYFQIKQ